MAKDLFHPIVRVALEKDGWRITHDPYPLSYGIVNLYIDLAAEITIGAEKEERKIAVEVKSFASGSVISEFHTALGQYLNYKIALENSKEPDRILFLAVPSEVEDTFLRFDLAKTIIQRYQLQLIVYDVNREVISKWIK